MSQSVPPIIFRNWAVTVYWRNHKRINASARSVIRHCARVAANKPELLETCCYVVRLNVEYADYR